MATIQSVSVAGVYNWSATATWTGGVVPVAGDDVVLRNGGGGSVIVVIDTDVTVNSISITQGSYFRVESTRNVTITNTFSNTSTNGRGFEVSNGGSLTLRTGTFVHNSSSSVSFYFTGAGGTIDWRRHDGSSTDLLGTLGPTLGNLSSQAGFVQFANTTGPAVWNSVGVLNVVNTYNTARNIFNFTGVLFGSGNSLTHTGNITASANCGCVILGSVGQSSAFVGNVTFNGDVHCYYTPTVSTSYPFFDCYINGTLTINGDLYLTATQGPRVVFSQTVSGTAPTVVMNGDIHTNSPIIRSATWSGTFNWSNQTVNVLSTDFVEVHGVNTSAGGTFDLRNLIFVNYGQIVIRMQNITNKLVTGCQIQHQSPDSGAAIFDVSGIDVVYYPEDDPTFPDENQVQAGVSYGYVASPFIGTALLLDSAVLAAALTSADVATGTDITTLETAIDNIDLTASLNLNGINPTRMGYIDNLNIGGNVASSTEVTSIQNNTRVVRVVPDSIERPDSGTTTYRVELLLYDDVGNMEVPDSAPTIDLVNQSGTSRTSRLDSTTMTLVETGRYRAIYTASSTDDLEQLIWTFSVVEGGATRKYGNNSLIVDTTAVDFTSSDRTKLNTIESRIDMILSDVNTNVSSKPSLAQIRAEVDDAFVDYDPATGADLTAGLDLLPTAAENAAQVRVELATELGRIDMPISTVNTNVILVSSGVDNISGVTRKLDSMITLDGSDYVFSETAMTNGGGGGCLDGQYKVTVNMYDENTGIINGYRFTVANSGGLAIADQVTNSVGVSEFYLNTGMYELQFGLSHLYDSHAAVPFTLLGSTGIDITLNTRYLPESTDPEKTNVTFVIQDEVGPVSGARVVYTLDQDCFADTVSLASEPQTVYTNISGIASAPMFKVSTITRGSGRYNVKIYNGDRLYHDKMIRINTDEAATYYENLIDDEE